MEHNHNLPLEDDQTQKTSKPEQTQGDNQNNETVDQHNQKVAEETNKAPQKQESVADAIIRQLARHGKNVDLPKVPSPVEQDNEKDKTEAIEPPTKEKPGPNIKEDDELIEEGFEDEDENNDQESSNENTSEKKPVKDYSKYSKGELIDELKALLEQEDINAIRADISTIKTHFYKLHHAEQKEKRQAFLEIQKEKSEESEIVEYTPETDPIEEEFKTLLQSYKNKRSAYIERLEQEKQENLKAKKTVIEEIKELINTKESINQTFNDFHALQDRWRTIGPVPSAENKNLWETYHHQIEKFYDWIKINKELRDLDLKKNLEAKIQLCERAEELLLENSVIKAFRTLQKYHDQWREIGPVPREQREIVWERFKEATATINKRHQDYFEQRKVEQENNLKAKTLLCERAEELSEMEINSYKEWNKKSDEMIELQKLWKLIGFAPKRHNTKIYERFRAACDVFFNKKRDFFAQIKEEQQQNLQRKTELCIQAEGMKDSTDWKKTSQEFIDIQNQWKKIGPVPRKHSDAIWKRFRSACNHFFNQKKTYFASIDEVQEENLRKKEALIKIVEEFEPVQETSESLKRLKDIQKEWAEIGFVPIKRKDDVQQRFRTAINKCFKELKVDDRKHNEMEFQQKLENIQQTGGNRARHKLRGEQEKLIAKLNKTENDIALWENNIGFFAKSKNAESMIKNMERQIEEAKASAKMLRQKIRMIEKSGDAD